MAMDIDTVTDQSRTTKHNDECYVCRDGGVLVCCDFCEKSFHMECNIPKLTCVPTGQWKCCECAATAFKKKSRCGECEACFRRENCGKCAPCKQKKEFGGNGWGRNTCKERVCPNKRYAAPENDYKSKGRLSRCSGETNASGRRGAATKNTPKVHKRHVQVKHSTPRSSKIRKKCGECEACSRHENCGECAPCRRKIEFGGNGRSHETCKKRDCPYKRYATADNAQILRPPKRSRCGKCEFCSRRENCGECTPCRQKIEFGGNGRDHRTCKKRDCPYKRYATPESEIGEVPSRSKIPGQTANKNTSVSKRQKQAKYSLPKRVFHELSIHGKTSRQLVASKSKSTSGSSKIKLLDSGSADQEESQLSPGWSEIVKTRSSGRIELFYVTPSLKVVFRSLRRAQDLDSILKNYPKEQENIAVQKYIDLLMKEYPSLNLCKKAFCNIICNFGTFEFSRTVRSSAKSSARKIEYLNPASYELGVDKIANPLSPGWEMIAVNYHQNNYFDEKHFITPVHKIEFRSFKRAKELDDILKKYPREQEHVAIKKYLQIIRKELFPSKQFTASTFRSIILSFGTFQFCKEFVGTSVGSSRSTETQPGKKRHFVQGTGNVPVERKNVKGSRNSSAQTKRLRLSSHLASSSQLGRKSNKKLCGTAKGSKPVKGTGKGGNKETRGNSNKKLLPENEDLDKPVLENVDTGSVSLAGSHIHAIRLGSNKRKACLLDKLFPGRVLVVELKLHENPPDLTFPFNGRIYELASRKVLRKNKKGMKAAAVDMIKLGYVATEGKGLETLDLPKELQKLCSFSCLSTEKCVSRLSHLMSEADRFYSFTSDKLEIIEENGHEGCGFFPEGMFGEKADAIQIRLIAPKLGFAKGLLAKKRGISRIQIPESMLKVPASKLSEAKSVTIVVTQTFPSDENHQLGRFLDCQGEDACESWRIQKKKTLSDMYQRLLIGFGVPNDIIGEYARKSRKADGTKHCHLMGIADPTGSIPAGKIFITGYGNDGDERHLFGKLNQMVFVARSPSLEPTDAKILSVVGSKPKEMKKSDWDFLCSYKFGFVIFGNPNSNLNTPLPCIISDGDLDGDSYFVCWDDIILENLHRSKSFKLLRDLSPLESNHTKNKSTKFLKKGMPNWLGKAQEEMLDFATQNTLSRLTGKLYKCCENVSQKANGTIDIYDEDACAFSQAFKASLDAQKHGNGIYLPDHLHEYVPKSLQSVLSPI